jgi:DNA-binding transcriptional LysR family regulator
VRSAAGPAFREPPAQWYARDRRMVGPGSVTQQLDWNDVRFFLAVARGRTLAKAAAALRVDQTTVGRRIASLEGKLRVALFKRSVSGFQVSPAGARVLEAAERMEEAALDVAAGSAGEDTSSSGTVRVATTESLAEAFVIPAIRQVRALHPRVRVVLATGWVRVDLRRGEADLAVRLVRPSDPRLACRKLADFSLRLYASRAYVAERGMPTGLDGHALIAYEDAVLTTARHPFANLPMDRGELALMSNCHRVLLVGALCGLGIVQMPSYVGDAQPDLVRVCGGVEEPYAVWLVVPQANRRIAAVRVVSDAIAAALRVSAKDSRGRRPR